MPESELRLDAGEYGRLLLSLIDESPGNPRRHFDPQKMQDLTESIRQHGVIEPILVRPQKKRGQDRYEVVVGARRTRAAKLAGLEKIPARCAELTDQQVAEIQVIENLQREDIHPLEEADGFARLLATDGYTAEVIAEKIGKSASYVHKRLALTKLIEPLKGKFLNDEINLGHAFLLCRLQEPDQIRAGKEALFRAHWQGSGKKEVKKAVEIASLDDWIHRNILLVLNTAPWAKDDAGLFAAAGACTSCPKRTGSNLALFDDLSKDDRCLDRRCFEKKMQAHIEREADRVEAAGAKLVRVADGYTYGVKLPKGTVASHDYKEAAKDCANPEAAIVVAGEQPGRLIRICRKKGCKAHGYNSLSSRHVDSPKEVWVRKERALVEDIKTAARVQILKAVLAKAPKLIGKAELGWIGAALLANIDQFETLEIAKILPVGLDPKDRKKVFKFLLGRIQLPENSYGLYLDCLAIALLPAAFNQSSFDDDLTGGNLLDKAAKSYGIDGVAIANRLGADRRTEFKKQRDAALSRAKVKKPKAAKKGKRRR